MSVNDAGREGAMVFYAFFNYISAILWRPVKAKLETHRAHRIGCLCFYLYRKLSAVSKRIKVLYKDQTYNMVFL